MADNPRCEAITRSGSRCKSRARSGSAWCRNHDPALAAQRKLNASAGGKTRSRHRPTETERVRKKLWEITFAVLDGSLDRNLAAVATQALNGVLRSVEVEHRTAAVEEIEQRLETLELEEDRAKWAR